LYDHFGLAGFPLGYLQPFVWEDNLHRYLAQVFSWSQDAFPVTQSLARALKEMQSTDPNQWNGRSLLYQSITGLLTKGS